MYIDPREHRCRTWRVIGRIVLSELRWIAAIIGFVMLMVAGGRAWEVSPLLVVIPGAAVLLGWMGIIMWCHAEDVARRELSIEQRILEKRERRNAR